MGPLFRHRPLPAPLLPRRPRPERPPPRGCRPGRPPPGAPRLRNPPGPGARGGVLGAVVLGAVNRLDLHIAVALHAGAGGDQLTDDDVLLQADEVVHLALDGGVGEDAGGLLELSLIHI